VKKEKKGVGFKYAKAIPTPEQCVAAVGFGDEIPTGMSSFFRYGKGGDMDKEEGGGQGA
jgi:hypothetical protein